MKKLYFLDTARTATHSQRWQQAHRNAYKSQDAMRDILDWAAEGREFYVALVNHDTNTRRVFHLNPPGSPEICTDFATKRPVVGVLDTILRLVKSHANIDIMLLERKRRRQPVSRLN